MKETHGETHDLKPLTPSAKSDDAPGLGEASNQFANRSVIDVGVAYDTDLDQAMTAIKEVADDLWHQNLEDATILEEPAVWGVQALGDSAITIRLAVKTDPSEQWTTSRLLNKAIKERLDAEGIEIPFPQTTVHVRREDPPV